MLTTLRRAEYAELIALFFLLGAALAMWFVPLSTVLEAYGLGRLRPYAFATSGLAAFVSPLLFGAVADRHVSPVKVLRWLALATAMTITLVSTAVGARAHPWLVLALAQLNAFCSAPTWSLASSIVFARLTDAKKEFGPIRATATLGWMGGCLLISAIGADRSTLAGYSAALMWLLVFALTFWLPVNATPSPTQGLTWAQRFGLDALTLLRNRDHRGVFLATSLFMIPLAAFYPYTPSHLEQLGLVHTTAWMSLGQVTETIAMLLISGLLLRWRIKWIIALGLAIGVLRFALCATNTRWGVLGGVLGHGGSFTFVFITAQIYLDQRVDPAWRTRAQALMTLMNSGLGNLIGYLGMGGWFTFCMRGGEARWPLFWSVVALGASAVLGLFLVAYRGRGAGFTRHEEAAK